MRRTPINKNSDSMNFDISFIFAFLFSFSSIYSIFFLSEPLEFTLVTCYIFTLNSSFFSPRAKDIYLT